MEQPIPEIYKELLKDSIQKNEIDKNIVGTIDTENIQGVLNTIRHSDLQFMNEMILKKIDDLHLKVDSIYDNMDYIITFIENRCVDNEC